MLSGMVAGFVENAAAIATHTAALIADKWRLPLLFMYAKDFCSKPGARTAALVQQANFLLSIQHKDINTAAQIAMTAATVA